MNEDYNMEELNELSQIILKHAFEIHSALGPGLLESAYKECLAYRLEKDGWKVEKEKPIPLIFEEIRLDQGYRLDLLVENKIVIELKSVELLSDLHIAQTLTYLRLGGYKLGLLLNFNTKSLKNGIKRPIM
jgi:GxxExxY protein